MNGSLLTGASGSSLDATESGQYRVTVRDANNRTAQSRLATLTVSPVGTPVALTSPTAGATVSGSYTVRANATGASKVEFWLDGTRRFTDSSAPFTWTWNTALDDNGTHQLVAKSFSGTNLLAATPSRTVAVDNTVLPPGPEPFEPNESSLTAMPLAFGTTTNGYIWTSRDVDWFSVNVATPGVVTIDLTLPPANDYDLELFGPDAAYLAGSYQNTGLAEHIALNAIATGTYWVRVYGYPVGNGSYNTNLTYTLTAAVSSGTVVILSPPQDRTVPAGASASFSVTAAGAPPLSYQWQCDAVDIPSATGPTFTTPGLTLADSGGQYRVRVSNAFSAVTSIVASVTVTAANSITWTGSGDGWNWNNPTNWNPMSVPDLDDSVVINSGSVNVPGDAKWGVLTLVGGILSGTFTNEGTLTWSAGVINGKMTIAPGGVLNITGTASHFGGLLDNYGTVIWTASTRFLGGTDLAITNRAGAIFDIRTDSDINNGGGGSGPGYSYSSAMPRFANYGTLIKSAGTGTNSLSITTFENSGVCAVQSGTIRFIHGFMNDGTINVTAGCNLQLAGGNYVCDSGSTLSAAPGGLVEYLSGDFWFNAGSSVAPTTSNRITGSIGFHGAINLPHLEMVGGILSGTFTNEGTLTWSAGVINGKMTIAPGGVLNITGTASHFGGLLDNYGTVIWTASTRFLGGTDLAITNRVGAIFDIRTDCDINNGGGGSGPGYSYGSAMPRFVNYGTLIKSAGTGTNSLSITTFENSGLLQIATGGLKFLHGYSQIAGNTLLAGGSISGTTMNLSGGRLSGIGLINAAVVNGAVVSPGASPGTLIINGQYTQTAAGQLRLEIGGTNPDSQYDRLHVTGTATLNGEILVCWTNAFVPSVGDSFQVMTFGSAVGSFATTNGLAFGNGIVLTSQWTSTSLTLRATDWRLLDSDNDGMNDWLETLAGTSPNNPASCLRLLPLLQSGQSPDSGFVVQWQSVTGRFYTVDRSTNLADTPAFSPVQSHIEGQADVTTYPDTNAVGAGPFFYRVQVEQ